MIKLKNSDMERFAVAIAIILLVVSFGLFLAMTAKITKGETIPTPATPNISATVPAFVTFERPFTVTFNSSGGSALVVTSPFSGTSSPYAADGSGQRCLHIGVNPDRYSCPTGMEMIWVMVPRILGKHDLKFEILDDSHDVVADATYTTIVLKVADKLYHLWLPLIRNN